MLGSTKVYTNQMLNNITQAQVDEELERITQGDARSGFSVVQRQAHVHESHAGAARGASG
jgi:hypothetical protein